MFNQLISVIVPVYNVDTYLPRCLESIINQTYKNLQIILVDDGSTDTSGSICDNYALIDKRIIVIHTENSGSVVARKKGLEKADGEYIGFVDGDDYIEQDMFYALYNKITETDADFVHSGYKKNDGNDIYSSETEKIYNIDDSNIVDFYHNNIFDTTFKGYISPSLWSKLYKRDVIIKSYMNLPNGQSYGEDLLCLCKSVYYSSKIAAINKGYYHYTIRSGSLSHKPDIDALINEYGLYKHLCDTFREIGLYSKMESDIKKFFLRGVALGLSSTANVYVPNYSYPFINTLFNKKIVIFGAGKVGQDYYSQICRYSKCRIIAWADTNYKDYFFDYCDIVSVDKLRELDFDMVIIAVLSEKTAMVIKETLKSKGIDEDKIVWYAPQQNI